MAMARPSLQLALLIPKNSNSSTNRSLGIAVGLDGNQNQSWITIRLWFSLFGYRIFTNTFSRYTCLHRIPRQRYGFSHSTLLRLRKNYSDAGPKLNIVNIFVNQGSDSDMFSLSSRQPPALKVVA